MPPRRRAKVTSSAPTTTAASTTTTTTTTNANTSPATSSTATATKAATNTTTGTSEGTSTATARHSTDTTTAASTSTTTHTTTTTTAAAGKSSSSSNNNNKEDSKSGTDTCLHCHNAAAGSTPGAGDNIQVRCDECGGYICNDCHWCHEFQANHEIRVCDRCDAFYCKSCDEMDQCDDCGEVVCGSCSTLLSCKFCGGGLCEDCATACGRCGIVLCSRDAKFAVDCDTCRLSYCLVCLASGSKDPCVRCGHRPSKRMEQLVHLRLKSIYKAFKQSSSSGSSSSNSNNNNSRSNNNNNNNNSSSNNHNITNSTSSASNVRERQNDDPDESHHMTEDPEALLQVAAASAAAAAAKLKASASSAHSGAAAAAAAAAAAVAAATPVSASERLEQYMAEKAKADKAAADLLAELEEEEEQKKSKKSKKKRKKERQQQAKQQSNSNNDSIKEASQDDDEEEDEDGENNKLNRKVRDDDSYYIKNNNKSRMESRRTTSSTSSSMAATSKSHEATAAAVAKFVSSSPLENLGVDEHDQNRDSSSPDVLLEPDMEADPLEEELEQLIEDEDVDGVEALLASIKGVPGRAALRKNAKKALKRFRTGHEDEHGGHEAEPEATNIISSSAVTRTEEPKVAGSQPPVSDLNPVKMVAKQSRSKGSTSAAGVPASTHASGSINANRTECVMHLAPAIVGWVIGKGGQRIRDLMEESGARIWIDQDSMGPGEPRMVFVSGHRKGVDTAMKLITELVKKAPPPTSQSKQNTPIIDSGATNAVKSSSESKPPTIPDAMELSKPAASLFGLKPRGKEAAELMAAHVSPSPPQSESTKAEHVMTCDPRFVPLLIGRRGWTIKNIQDSSGARVDIDQTVTPRQITISGKETSVEIAIRMVRDVLSYPHAQLQGTVEKKVPEDEGVCAAPLPTEEEKNIVPVAVVPEVTREVESTEEVISPVNDISLPESGMRGANSPPSSLIMTGDAKSTISASSSLSSTPEPSMASSMPKGGYSQIPPGPMLPPAFGFSAYDPSANDAVPLQSASIPVNSFMFPPGGHAPMPQEGLYGMSAAPPMPDPLRHQSGQSPIQQVQPARGPVGVVGGSSVPPPQPFHLGPSATTFVESSGVVLGPLTVPHGLPMNHPPSAFQPTHPGFPSGHGGTLPQSSILSEVREHSSIPRVTQDGLWNGIGATGLLRQSQVPRSTDGFHLDAAVDFLQNNKHGLAVHPLALSGIPNDEMGPLRAPQVPCGKRSLVLGQSHTVPGLLSNPTPDESQIVDSLFGPQTSVTNDGSLLMTGLHGLSLSKESDLWSSPAEIQGGDTLSGLGPLVADVTKKLQHPNLGLHSVGEYHPPQSRFAWGSFADR